MKAAPLLRKWLQRLRASGVELHARHVWRGWTDEGACRFLTPDGEVVRQADAVVLALGGASWARLGSDGVWQGLLKEQRSEEHTSELQSLMRISYADFCLKKKKYQIYNKEY